MAILENKKTKVQEVHYSRYIASWHNEGGHFFGDQFIKWLKENECTDEEVNDICEMARCGKMELELTAKCFVNKMDCLIKQMDELKEGEELEEWP